MVIEKPSACICGRNKFRRIATFTEPTKAETIYESLPYHDYQRLIFKCDYCGHFLSVSHMDPTALYKEDYVSSIYENSEGLRETFNRIISLPALQSDNAERVKKVVTFVNKYYGADILKHKMSLLDVGSGIGVFAYKIKEHGWDCTTIDPDIRSTEHARDVIGVDSICGDFMEISDIGKFDVITFNRVLEHVNDPVLMLNKSIMHLNDQGIVYVEVPDGELAVRDNVEREEFTIDHPHVFSASSLSILSDRAGFTTQKLERHREPSGKYSLYMFANILRQNV